MNQHNDWRPQELDLAEKAWRAGHSASEIARKLPGRTRSAVIGKAHRMGWIQQTRAKPSAPARAPILPKEPKAPKVKAVSANPRGAHRTAPRPGPQKKTPVVFGYVHATTHAEAETKREQAAVAGANHIKSFHFPANDDAIPLIQRQFGQCSWPVGTPERPADQLCCGQRVIGDRTKSTATYCDMHRMRAAPAGVPSVRDLSRSVRRAA